MWPGGAWFRYGEPLDFARITRSDKLSVATTLVARDVPTRLESESCDLEFLAGSDSLYWVPLYDSRRS